MLPKYSLQDNSTATKCARYEYRFQDIAKWPMAASITRAIPHGDHSNDGLERSYVPSPWQPKSGNLLGAPVHSASIIFIPASFVGYDVPCSFYQDNFHQLAGHAAQLQHCVHTLILPVKWISAKTINCYGGLWEDREGVKLVGLGADRQSLLVADVLLNMLPSNCLGLLMSNIPNKTQYATSD